MTTKTDVGSQIDAQEMTEAISAVPCTSSDASNALNDRLFVSAVCLTVEVMHDKFVKSKTVPKSAERTVASTKSKPRCKLTPETLSQKWSIGPEAAKRTLRVTAQRGVKTVADPSVSR